MLNNVYPLNLPDYAEVIHKSIDLNFFKNNIIHYPNVIDIVKKEFLNIQGLNFTNCLILFKRPGTGSKVHIHGTNWTKEGPNKLVWGINWNIGSDGLYQFWKEKDIEKWEVQLNPQGRKHTILQPNKLPYEVYRHYTGPVLFNATLPHKAFNIGGKDRFVLSLRTDLDEGSWEAVVEKFKPIINIESKNIKRII
jgi:hypothetical protein